MRGARFRGVWRDYQASVLDSVEACLADRRVHVVAAPGSGKTVLGLELVQRIGRPALVLAPTVTIRAQWIERLRELFLEAGEPAPDWASTALDAPGRLTVTTYQALHAAGDGDGGDGEAVREWIESLRALGPLTLVLDEAHHLRREWWRALSELIEALPEPVIVALTATPPYDVPIAEWQRYEGLCGPVDAEIAAPELVRNGDLCPHQDYLHLSTPTADELAWLEERRAGLNGLFLSILDDPALLDAVAGFAWLCEPEVHEAAILDDPEFMSALLIVLAAAGRARPRPALALLGIEGDGTPPISPYWFERLLDGMIVDHRAGFAAAAARLGEIKAALQRLGAFEGGRVRIRETERLVRMMAGSTAKLGSMVEIARTEHRALGDRLRLAVLADHVRLADLPGSVQGGAAPTKLGVATIFDVLRREVPEVPIGVLSGPLVIVPEAALPALAAAAAACGVAPHHVETRPLPHCPGFVRITFRGETGHQVVAVMTRLFTQGDVRLLVGTQSLLGEGWDAPAVNALILASNVGSYMLSNQMRGRAIRIDPADPAKVANIWHLATIAPEGTDSAPRLFGRSGWSEALPPSDPVGRPLGPDMELMKRRFRAFAGVAADGSTRIETGLGRLGLRGRGWDRAGVAATNGSTLRAAADRPAVARRWQESVGGPEPGRRMHQAVRPTYAPRGLAFIDTLQFLAITGLGGGALSAGQALRSAGSGGLGWLLIAFAGLTLLYAAPKLLRALYLLVRNGTLETSLGEVGGALLDTFAEAGLLAAPVESIGIHVERSLKGERLVTLDGADRATERMFLEAMAELLSPVRNPRYLLVRHSWFARRLRIDFHAVPAVLGQRKEWAAMFAAHWARRVGKTELVYTRTAEGRRLLLRARARSLSAGLQRDVDLLSAWR